MKAHKVKYGTKVIVTDEDVKTPPSSIPVNKGDEITIHRNDGMYCNGIDKNGNRIYIAGWTKVEPCMCKKPKEIAEFSLDEIEKLIERYIDAEKFIMELNWIERLFCSKKISKFLKSRIDKYGF